MDQIRPAVAYHIKRLEEYGEITPLMHQRASVVRDEGGREVYRKIDVFNVFALRAIVHSFTTDRADEVERLCDKIIARNDDANYGKRETKLID